MLEDRVDSGFITVEAIATDNPEAQMRKGALRPERKKRERET